VARAIAAESLDEAGERAREELAAESRQIAYANLLLAGELPRLLDRFAAAGIRAVPYKGPTLAAAAFGNLALRPYVDLDVVVGSRDFVAAKRVLEASGFAPSADDFASVRHLSHEQAFGARQGRVQIDLHGRLFSRELFPVDLAEMLDRLESVRVGGREVPTFAAEELLVVLAEHAHKHLWQRLAWLADLAHLIAARPAFDWARTLAFARRSGSLRVLAIGVGLAAELLAAPVPSEILARLRSDPVARELEREVRERLFAELRGELVELEFELSRLQWRSRERWRDRLRYALTPNESDWIVVPLPRALGFVYYFVRPVRLVAKYGVGRLLRAG
jgi:hypothetical protein